MTEENRKDTISFFSMDMRKIIKLRRQGDRVLLAIEPFVVDVLPWAYVPTELFVAIGEENAKNAENPGMATFPVEVLSNPKFLEFIGAKL